MRTVSATSTAAKRMAGRLPLQGGRVTAVTVVTAILGYPLLLSLKLKAV